MQLGISEILEKISNEKDELKRQNMLAAQVKNQGVLNILKMAYDPNIKFNLPEGKPPYKPCQFLDQQAMLYNSLKTFYLFIGEGNPRVPKVKKEAMFINMLQSLDPADAELVLAVKEKTIPYECITEDLVRKTFPGLLPPAPVKEEVVAKETKKKVKKNEQK
jgi:hypothetical protein